MLVKYVLFIKDYLVHLLIVNQVAECYGQTETTCCITHSLVQDPTAGHVGPVNPGLEMKLKDVPEMKYFAEQDEGEVCVRGANVFDGYWQDEEKTKETKDEDGWLATGDIGRWLPVSN